MNPGLEHGRSSLSCTLLSPALPSPLCSPLPYTLLSPILSSPLYSLLSLTNPGFEHIAGGKVDAADARAAAAEGRAEAHRRELHQISIRLVEVSTAEARVREEVASQIDALHAARATALQGQSNAEAELTRLRAENAKASARRKKPAARAAKRGFTPRQGASAVVSARDAAAAAKVEAAKVEAEMEVEIEGEGQPVVGQAWGAADAVAIPEWGTDTSPGRTQISFRSQVASVARRSRTEGDVAALHRRAQRLDERIASLAPPMRLPTPKWMDRVGVQKATPTPTGTSMGRPQPSAWRGRAMDGDNPACVEAAALVQAARDSATAALQVSTTDADAALAVRHMLQAQKAMERAEAMLGLGSHHPKTGSAKR